MTNSFLSLETSSSVSEALPGMSLSSKVILMMEKRDLDGLKQNHVKQLSQTPQTWCVGKSSSPRSCELCLTVHGEVSSWGKHRETDKKSPTPFQNLYPGKTVLHSTKQAKKKGEHFVALSSGKDTLGDGRKQGSKFSSWALWYCRSLRSLKDSGISMTNENKYRKSKGNILIPPASSPMSDRNMKTQKRSLKMAFIYLFTPLHPDTMGSSEPQGSTMTKGKGKDRREG